MEAASEEEAMQLAEGVDFSHRKLPLFNWSLVPWLVFDIFDGFLTCPDTVLYNL